jgi:acetylglutamate kinase
VKILIKLGGTLLEEPAARNDLARQLADVAQRHQLVVVHGGGKQVTRFLDERGVKSTFVDGLRVSNEDVIDAVTKVIAGTINKQLVTSLTARKVGAVGLSGLDGFLTMATQLNPDLGFVGKPRQTDGRLLRLLLDAGYLPVIACIAGDEDGHIYNVNADQMAVSCATGFSADRLLFLTDVPGVKGADGNVLPLVTSAECQRLIDSGVAHGGMQAKLEAARAALDAGIGDVWVAPGREPDVCSRLADDPVQSDRICGTRITVGALSSKVLADSTAH